jgi:phenylacetic acid degradation operon negative regulatory protein
VAATGLQTACSGLVEGYRAAPEYSARTLLVTVFGDSLRPHGGEAWIGNLVHLMTRLGINERLTRTSLNRLMGEGVVTTRRQGRSSFYRITPSANTEFASVEDRIYHRAREEWDGRWVVVVELSTLPPATRGALRQRLGWIGFAGLTSGVMICPSGAADAAAVIDDLGADDSVALFCGEAGGPKPELEDRRLAELSSGLGALVPYYEAFLERFTPLARAGGADPAPELAFCARTLLVHAYRRITLREPELPAGLWPEDWIGDEAYAVAASTWHRLFPAAESHLESVWTASGNPLPPLDPAFTDRYPG